MEDEAAKWIEVTSSVFPPNYQSWNGVEFTANPSSLWRHGFYSSNSLDSEKPRRILQPVLIKMKPKVHDSHHDSGNCLLSFYGFGKQPEAQPCSSVSWRPKAWAGSGALFLSLRAAAGLKRGTIQQNRCRWVPLGLKSLQTALRFTRGFIIPHSKLPEEIAFIAATLYVKSEARWTEKQLSVGISRQVTEMKDRISSRISVGLFSTYLSTCDSNCFTMNTDQIFVEQRGFLCSAHC